MAICQRLNFQIIGIIFTLICGCSTTFAAKDVGMRHEGITQLVGSVISTPCSIVMNNRYQTVNFLPLTLTMLSTETLREQHTEPFDIELHDCGSVYSLIDSKTWTIRFEGQNTEDINAFLLQGPSEGLGISVFDNKMQKLTPGNNYPLFNNILRHDESDNTLFLRYFVRLELTGKPIQAGSYQGLVRFFIDYQ